MPLLAQDGELQSLLEVPAAKLGHLVMLGDIILQSKGGVIGHKGGRTPATALESEPGAEGGPTSYGQLKIHLRPDDWMLPMLSKDLWPIEVPPNHDLKYLEYMRACLYAAIHWHPGMIPALSGQSDVRAFMKARRGKTRPGKSRPTQRVVAPATKPLPAVPATQSSSKVPAPAPDAQERESRVESKPGRRMRDIPPEYEIPEADESDFNSDLDAPVTPQVFAPDSIWDEMKAAQEMNSARVQEQHSAVSNATDCDILPNTHAARDSRHDLLQKPSDSTDPDPKTKVVIKNLKGIFE